MDPQLFLNIGFFLNLIALAFREILWIRVLLTCGYFLRFITNVFNPKATLFFLSMFSLVIEFSTPVSIKIFYGLWMSIITCLWFCLVSFLFTSKFSEIFVSKYAQIIDKIMGMVLMVISIKLILF